MGNKLNSINTTERVKDIQCTLQPLREVWLKVGLEKLESHEGIAVKALLDSGVTGLFMDMTFAKKKGFKMEKLKKPLLVRNVDGTANVGGAIIHQVEYNMFFKGHMERASINSVFPKLHTSILALSICPLKNILHSTWCIIVPPAFAVPSTFLTKRGFSTFSF